MKPGDKVTYKTEYKNEKGIVKSICEDNHAFVVYHCANDWKDYHNYTAAKTRMVDLVKGWEND